VSQGRGESGEWMNARYVAVPVSEESTASCPEKNDSAKSVFEVLPAFAKERLAGCDDRLTLFAGVLGGRVEFRLAHEVRDMPAPSRQMYPSTRACPVLCHPKRGDSAMSEVTPRKPEEEPEALRALMESSWPGNVRELASSIERAVVFGVDETIDPKHLSLLPSASPTCPWPFPSQAPWTIRQLNRVYMDWVLSETRGNKPRAAEILGIGLSTLYRSLAPKAERAARAKGVSPPGPEAEAASG
jgi:hypothetical protein